MTSTVLYILCGCVALALGAFIVGVAVTALRPPQLPTFEPVVYTPPSPLPTGPMVDEELVTMVRPEPAQPMMPFAQPSIDRPTVAMRPAARPAAAAASYAQTAPAASYAQAAPAASYAQATYAASASAFIPTPTVGRPRLSSAPTTPPPSFTPTPPSFVLPSTARSRRFARGSSSPIMGGDAVQLNLPPARAQLAMPLARPSHPTLQRRRRPVLRVFVVTIAFVITVGAIGVAQPSLMDPLCDDYEWFGADTAAVARDYAWTAHDWIYDLVHGQ